MYKKIFFVCYDDLGFIKYFSNEDFASLCAKRFEFKSSHSHNLVGYFYNYPEFDKDRLIVFVHGLGGGHRSYMKEIEVLCRAGYRVFSYDHTGCMESGGENQLAASQFICDLDDCLKALKTSEYANFSELSLMGHSLGAYAVMNILPFYPNVKKSCCT